LAIFGWSKERLRLIIPVFLSTKTKHMVKEKRQLDSELDKATIAKIKKELLARKKQIVIDLNSLSGKNKDKKEDHHARFPDFGDKSDENAQEISEYSTNLATEQVLEKTLRDIDNALDRITKRTYGICKYCGQPIGKKRLLARSVASACVACKNKLQQGS